MKITNSGRGIHQREIPGLDKLKGLPDHWHAFTNLDLALPGRGIREIDLVMVIEDRLLLIDLKDWLGPVTSKDGNWFNGNRDCGRSPVHKIGENVRELAPLLKKFLTEQLRREHGPAQKVVVPWVEGAVVLTRTPDRTGISGSEVARVFSIDPFMRILKNRKERDAQLSTPRSKSTDFTAPEWVARFRQFFNTSTGIFQAGARRYGGFRATSESPTFSHRNGIFSEFDVNEEGVEISSGLLRRWDFTRAETRYQSEEARASIVGREKTVIAWLDDRNPSCGSVLLKPKVDDPDRGVAYWEVFDKRRRMKRLSEFCATGFHATTVGERIELARQILAAAKTFHDLQAAHLDIGAHSIWLEPPSTVKFSHFMAASFPEIETLGNARFQFLSSSTVPEDVLGADGIPIRKDVFLLGCVIHTLLLGAPPGGDPPEWKSSVDADGVFSTLHPWFERSLEIDHVRRFGNAAEMLDAFNAAVSSGSNEKATIEGLEKFRTLKSQRQVFQAYPESELLLEDDRVVIWRTSDQKIVKLWKASAIGDVSKEAPRILAFLERAEALLSSPIQGVATMHAAHWTGDAIVLVQSFVEGPTLSDEIANRRLLATPEATVEFLIALIKSVGILHERSLPHGDLKPSNIIVDFSVGEGRPSPVMIDVLDFAPSQDGQRMSSAYSPASGGRFERDRFAVTKIAGEVLQAVLVNGTISADLARAIERCRVGPPTNATLLPLEEALERAISPVVPAELGAALKVVLPNCSPGLILPDEGVYWISKFGFQVIIRGAIEQLEIRLDALGQPVAGKRVKPTQNSIQRSRRHEVVSFPGSLILERGTNDLTAVASILERDDIVSALARRLAAKPEVGDDSETDPVGTEAQQDNIAERVADASAEASTVDVRRLWRRMVDVEAELTTEAACIGDSSFRKDTKRHVVPIQMIAGELDFDRDDTVVVERQDAKGRWTRIGLLDLVISTPGFIAVESWMGSDRQALVADGDLLRFQSRYENTSRERREVATSRILQGASASPALIEAFDPTVTRSPSRLPVDADEAELEKRYGLNPVQVDSFKTILECRPVGLLQGPPGTGKTRFIGALVHFALTHGLVRNVLLASQSHEAVNNAGEAVLDLFGSDRDSLSLIRVGHEGSVSESLRPFHVACVERAYKDRFVAMSKPRLNLVGKTLGLDSKVIDDVLHFEDAVVPVLARIGEFVETNSLDSARLNSLKVTVEQQLASRGINMDLSNLEASSVDDQVTARFMSDLPSNQAANIEKFRQVVQLSRDIIGSVSTWQRSFETFLAGTRQVVAGTCVGLGRTSLGLTKTVFDLVIVDEAARCTSSELAVPIQAGKWIVLVGDHAQLEPLHRPEVVESVADELRMPLHEVMRSDFERVFQSTYGQAAGSTLTKQYRMLPPIGRLVSTAFYDRALAHGRTDPYIDVDAMPIELTKCLTWVSTDLLGSEAYQKPDKVRRGSLTNPVEAEAIVTMLKSWSTNDAFLAWLTSLSPQTKAKAIGVICAYAAQRDLVWKKLQAENLPDAIRRSLKVDTIDSYQGKENVLVLLSLVRNNSDGKPDAGVATIAPGFMGRKNRINVALSRAMDRLVIIGARAGWRRGTPLGRVVNGFNEEIKCDEAIVVDVQRIFEVPATTTRGKKKGAQSAQGSRLGAAP
ncbi:MAG: NERD domain-containing protein [Rhodocyclales bacterium]|nr:NERD domain-containing protein [Rhodocyclales bacterium]